MAKKVITKEDVDAVLYPESVIIAPVPEGEEAPVFEQSVQALYLDAYGREKPNPIPLEPPIGYVKRPTVAETMRQMIQQASYEAKQAGAETEEEANDFDVDEEFDPVSPWEHDFEPDPVLDRMIALASRPPAPPAAAPAAPPAEPGKIPSGATTVTP